MQIKSFTYTKSNGSTSERTVLVISKPSQLLAALDISELDDEQQAMAAVEFGRLRDEYLAKLEVFKRQFDLTQSYRNFTAANITNAKDEHV
jgi:predicted aminopeptidase